LKRFQDFGNDIRVAASGVDMTIMSQQDGKTSNNQAPTSAINHDITMRTLLMIISNDYQM
jgi:hypothetical protein